MCVPGLQGSNDLIVWPARKQTPFILLLFLHDDDDDDDDDDDG